MFTKELMTVDTPAELATMISLIMKGWGSSCMFLVTTRVSAPTIINAGAAPKRAARPKVSRFM